LKAVVIALDRCERGAGNTSTLAEIEAQGVRVLSIITLHDLIEYLQDVGEVENVARLLAYQREYGV